METLEEIEGVILDQVSQIEELQTPPVHVAHAIARELCDYFAGTQVYFPKNTQVHYEDRDGALRADYIKGKSVEQLSRKYGLSQGGVYRVLRKHRSKN